MARAYASTIFKAPVETVWSLVRDFNALPAWAPSIAKSKIEDKLHSDVVGCVRSFHDHEGFHIRERLLALDDANWTFTYNFEKPAFPVRNYIATLRLYPVTQTNQTFAEWGASFDEGPGDEGKYERIISKDVFASNFANLTKIIAQSKLPAASTEPRWKGGQPSKVWTSRHIKAPLADVWGVMRDFAGMGAWHDGMTKMHMLNKHRSDKVSATRDFYSGPEHLHEQLIQLSDLETSLTYRITKSNFPWINYVSGFRLWPVTAGNSTFGVWTGNWDASPQDDVRLMPDIEANVYQRGFAGAETLARKR